MKETKKKLLIYAHYYIPDKASTGQILKDLAEGMTHVFDITVICVVPSYLGTIDERYKKQKYYIEKINGVKVFRIRVPEFSKTNKLSRINNILSYFVGALAATIKVGPMDYIFAISQPPILGGLLGVWGKWVKRAKYIYNIQDFNPEQIIAVGYSKNKLLLKIMLQLDKFSCRYADKVILVGRDMGDTLKKRFRRTRVPDYTFINNWIDEAVVYPLDANHKQVCAFKKRYGLEDRFIIMYSGNIGLYYDLENLMGVIKRFPVGTIAGNKREVAFVFCGAGSELDKLISYKEQYFMENVFFIPYQEKSKLNYSLNAADVHWVVNSKGMKGVSVPSKCYGALAVGKPIMGVLDKGSECSLLIEEMKCGLCCEPGNYAAIEQQLNWFIQNAGGSEMLDMGKRGRRKLVDNLAKDISVSKYLSEILES